MNTTKFGRYYDKFMKMSWEELQEVQPKSVEEDNAWWEARAMKYEIIHG